MLYTDVPILSFWIKLDEYTLCFCLFDLGLKGCIIILKKLNLINDTHLILFMKLILKKHSIWNVSLIFLELFFKFLSEDSGADELNNQNWCGLQEINIFLGNYRKIFFFLLNYTLDWIIIIRVVFYSDEINIVESHLSRHLRSHVNFFGIGYTIDFWLFKLW